MRRKIIQIDESKCDGCGLCATACHEGAIEIISGKARLVSETYCDGLGDCLKECPQGAITIIEREAAEYDEAVVQERMKKKHEGPKASPPCSGYFGGCPSARILSFNHPTDDKKQSTPPTNSSTVSNSKLSQWPILLNLVPPTAPFLDGADLLIAATCTAFSHGNFHNEFLEGRTLIVACPKFSEISEMEERITAILSNNRINSLTVVTMEVPCCGALSRLVSHCAEKVRYSGSMEQIVLTLQGQIKSKNYVAGS